MGEREVSQWRESCSFQASSGLQHRVLEESGFFFWLTQTDLHSPQQAHFLWTLWKFILVSYIPRWWEIKEKDWVLQVLPVQPFQQDNKRIWEKREVSRHTNLYRYSHSISKEYWNNPHIIVSWAFSGCENSERSNGSNKKSERSQLRGVRRK